MSILSASQIADALATLPGWRMESGELRRHFKFGDFRESMSFVNSVASAAERAGHHPDIQISYDKVALALVSHDAGGITEKDVALASEIATLL